MKVDLSLDNDARVSGALNILQPKGDSFFTHVNENVQFVCLSTYPK